MTFIYYRRITKITEKDREKNHKKVTERLIDEKNFPKYDKFSLVMSKRRCQNKFYTWRHLCRDCGTNSNWLFAVTELLDSIVCTIEGLRSFLLLKKGKKRRRLWGKDPFLQEEKESKKQTALSVSLLCSIIAIASRKGKGEGNRDQSWHFLTELQTQVRNNNKSIGNYSHIKQEVQKKKKENDRFEYSKPSTTLKK